MNVIFMKVWYNVLTRLFPLTFLNK